MVTTCAARFIHLEHLKTLKHKTLMQGKRKFQQSRKKFQMFWEPIMRLEVVNFVSWLHTQLFHAWMKANFFVFMLHKTVLKPSAFRFVFSQKKIALI